jgi:hypothetical protein
MSRKHMGSSIDDFLKEEGIFEEAQAQAVKEVGGVAVREGHAEKENIQVADGRALERENHRALTTGAMMTSAWAKWRGLVPC